MPDRVLPTPTQPYHDRAVTALVPFFAARSVPPHEDIRRLLLDYEVRTPREVQLAAEIIALTVATLACLRASMATHGLSVAEVLALQDSALGLERLSRHANRALIKCRQDGDGAQAEWDEARFRRTMQRALATLKRTDPPPPGSPPAPPPKLSIVSAEPMTRLVLADLVRAGRIRRQGR